MAGLKDPVVSIMMPAYNAAPFVSEAVESVLAQSFRGWELIVVDDGSTDETAALVERFRDPRIRLFSKENGGESSARNVALEASKGEFIAYLDADDVYLPDHLAVTIGYLRANTDRDAVYTDGFYIDATGRKLATLQSRRRGPFEGRLYEQVARASDVFGPPMSVVLRHALVAKHRLSYDPRIVIGPDWDFFLQVADVGSFGFVPLQTGLYRLHTSNVTTRVKALQRAASLAICREKAIRMSSFSACSVETRVAVFYDLLVNLLGDRPDRRSEAVAGPEFAALPAPEQARLLRLMAADALLHDADAESVGEWLGRAKRLNRADGRARVLASAHAFSPAACRALVRASARLRGRREPAEPFAGLKPCE